MRSSVSLFLLPTPELFVADVAGLKALWFTTRSRPKDRIPERAWLFELFSAVTRIGLALAATPLCSPVHGLIVHKSPSLSEDWRKSRANVRRLIWESGSELMEEIASNEILGSHFTLGLPEK